MTRTFSDMRQLREELVEFLLTLIQLSTSHVVHPEQCHDAVDDQETVLVADEEFSNLVEELKLVLRVDSSSIGDVVLGCLRIHTEALCDLGDPLGPEGAFGVDVRDFALSSTEVFGKLGDDRHGMRQLSLSAAELSKHLADAHGLEATIHLLVEAFVS